MRRCVAFAALLCLATFAVRAADAPKSAPAKPDVVGDWIGLWGGFDPSKTDAIDRAGCKAIDCKIAHEDGVWKATFEGECGRPYKYTITMEGREANGTVLFRGTTDLGEKDGGVYDWVGRATDKALVGFYTSSHHVGVFNLTRK